VFHEEHYVLWECMERFDAQGVAELDPLFVVSVVCLVGVFSFISVDPGMGLGSVLVQSRL
jgi:hypothetical protein